MKHSAIPLFLLAVLPIAGCYPAWGTASPPPTPSPLTPTILTHPKPALKTDWTPFRDAGCMVPVDWKLYCPEESPLGVLGCEEIRRPSPFFGGLDPAYPIALCLASRSPEGGKKPFYTLGCGWRMDVFYVIREKGEFRLLDSRDALQETFAPVESPEEALSYAMAVTGYHASFDGVYGHVAPEDYRYAAEIIEDTHVEPAEGGYTVNLYSRQGCGCGPKRTYEIVLRVTAEGAVETLSKTAAYDDMADTVCVD